MIKLSNEVYILEWKDSEITLEFSRDDETLSEKEQKALYDYLKNKFESINE